MSKVVGDLPPLLSVSESAVGAAPWLNALFQNMTLGVLCQDADGTITAANPAAERLLGLSLDQLLGKVSADPCWRALREDGTDLPGAEHPSMIALKTGQQVSDVVIGVFEPKAQETRWLLVTAIPFVFDTPFSSRVYCMFEDITERRAAEFALDSVSDAFVVLDRDWHFVYVNTPGTRMLSRKREELLGRSIWEAFPLTIGTISDQEYHCAMDEQKEVSFEQYYPPLSAWFNVRAKPSPTRLSIYFHDITYQKASVQAAEQSTSRLIESERSLLLALESGRLGSYDLDLETDELNSASPIFKGLFGSRPDDNFTRGDSLRRIHPDDMPMIREVQSERLRTGRTHAVEFRVVWPDGTIHWLRSHGLAPLVDGRQTRMFGLTQDITEQKESQEAADLSLKRLLESDQRLRLALESGMLGSYELDIETDEFSSISPMFKMLYGAAPEANLSRAESLRQIHPDDILLFRQVHAERLRTGQTQAVEFRVIWPDGATHWLRSHGLAVSADGRPSRMIGLVQDITSQKESEAFVREAAEQQRNMLRDVLSSVTGGKLRLVDTGMEMVEPLGQTSEPIALTEMDGLHELRQRVKEAAIKLDFSDERWQGLVTAASETGMNAVVHGGGIGSATVSTDGVSQVQVRVRDWGAGISNANLPNATLARGWSSTTSLGFGLVMSLETVDRLYLRTGPNGTTVVMEQDREE